MQSAFLMLSFPQGEEVTNNTELGVTDLAREMVSNNVYNI
jgi:hypothetical protein